MASPTAVNDLQIEAKFVSAVYLNPDLKGYLAEKIKINLEKRLLCVDTDTLLEPFRNRPGKQEWVGEHAGKFLHAAALTYGVTKNEALKMRMDRVVAALIACQEKDGYLGTYLPANRWESWDVWTHKYTMIGLLAYHEVERDEGSLLACKKMGDLVVSVFGNGPDKKDIGASGTHIGMAPTSILEPMVRLYCITHEQAYLDFCLYLVGSWEQENGAKIISSLVDHGDVYRTANNKAYEMLSCLVGLADLYKVTRNETYLKACNNAWKDIASKKTYIIGTSSFGEHFTPSGHLPAKGEYWNTKYVGPGEGCVTVTWIQFCQRMIQLTGKYKIVAELEIAIYNALLAAQNPQDGKVCYFLPLEGGRKRYGEVTHGLLPDICCCSSSIPRGIALIPELSAGTLNGIPTFLLYNGGRFVFQVKNEQLELEVQTDYPVVGSVAITILSQTPIKIPIQLAIPKWALDAVATVGNRRYTGNAGEFLKLKNTWKYGDTVLLDMKMPLEIVSDRNAPNPKFAFKRGPQILALDENISDASGMPASGWVGNDEYLVEAIVNGTHKKLHLVPFAEAGQTMARYNLLFDSIILISERKVKSLEIYRKQLELLRKEFPVSHLPDIDFFQFGMGNRLKLIYKNGKLFDTFSGDVVFEWQVKSETIVPNAYKVFIETITDNPVLIYENESGVFVCQGGKVELIAGTSAPINLPDFDGHRFSEVLKVLNHEILINIVDSKPVPNLIIYGKPWRRDAALMAMCLKETENLPIISDWVMSIREPYDFNNGGEPEADNLGQTLYLISLFADKSHPAVASVLAELPKYEVHENGITYIKGMSDFHEAPVYQTKWLKFGLKVMGLEDKYTIPDIQDNYATLFWWDYKDAHFGETIDAYEEYNSTNKHFYPYIGWAANHFHGKKSGLVSNRDYPLSWEQAASQANYEALEGFDGEYAKLKLGAPHTWHAGEMFLYLLFNY
ncbi:DUF1680 family protein [Cyclobacterium xiamenense]|uniref:DUF1680 family protein n=1 Tax=Cyclobacterium xiamenense TaxID=1297121 RepID=A0A1H7BJV3_9BACT|nr:beta-L-arabinofuranosidase domain-containing protein [Cyclobacterium xiamenense]SEJ77738.1 DUF1680 family protein [Cyclobacterium xiamenense]